MTCPFIARLNQPETTQRSSPVRPRGDRSGAGKVAEPRGVSVRVSAPPPSAILRPEVFNFLVAIPISGAKAPHSRDHRVPIKSRQEIKGAAAPKGINFLRHNGPFFLFFFFGPLVINQLSQTLVHSSA